MSKAKVVEPTGKSITVVTPALITEMASEQKRVVALVKKAQTLVISTPEQFEMVATEFKTISKREKELKTIQDTVAKPLKEARENLNALFEAPKEMLLQLKAAYNRAMGEWSAKQEAERKLAEAKAQEAARKEQDRLNKKADQLAAKGKAEQAELLREQAALAPSVPMVGGTEQPKVKGVYEVDNWTFEITDASLIPREYLVPDESAIRVVVKRQTSETQIPGIRVYNDRKFRG